MMYKTLQMLFKNVSVFFYLRIGYLKEIGDFQQLQKKTLYLIVYKLYLLKKYPKGMKLRTKHL